MSSTQEKMNTLACYAEMLRRNIEIARHINNHPEKSAPLVIDSAEKLVEANSLGKKIIIAEFNV